MHMDATHLQNNDYYNRSNKSCNVQFKSIEKFIQGIRKSHLNFASKAFKASKYGHGTVQPKIVHMQEVMQAVVVPQNT